MKRLKQLREEKQITQEELAKQLGLSKGIISLYEKEERNPSLDVIKNICKTFDCTIDYLMGLTNIRNPIDGLNTSKLNEETKRYSYSIYELQNQKELDQTRIMDLEELEKQLQEKDISSPQMKKLMDYLSRDFNTITTYEFEEFLSTLKTDVITFIADFKFKSSLKILQGIFEKQKFHSKYHKEMEGLTDEEIRNALQFYKEMKKKIKENN